MPIFGPKSNLIAKLFFLVIVCGTATLAVGSLAFRGSPTLTGQGEHVEQPVPFSHEHHVSGLGIDCRYCHTSVETSANAGFPSTHTCMTCHSQIWDQAGLLEPVRKSYAEDRPLRWKRVYRLPDYVYFDHSIHVARGVSCLTCHGPIDRMPLTAAAHPFTMRECLDCHENPTQYHVQPSRRLTDCYACHR